MLVGIANIYLYTGLSSTGADSAEALAWMQDNNIPHTHLHYGDPEQHKSVFDAVSTWAFGGNTINISEFPFVIYDERHDDYTTVRQCLLGLDAIKNSNLVELSALTASAE
jgi:hypothetical protein